MSYQFQKYASPIGALYLTARDEKLCAIIFAQNWAKFSARLRGLVESDTPLLQRTKSQLGEYFRGERKDFDLPYELSGSDFQHRAWNALAEIPFGETRTYKQQAVRLGAPAAARAIGRADGLNPLCIVLPCHRVIGSSGALTGYAGGLEAKRFLLELETGGVFAG